MRVWVTRPADAAGETVQAVEMLGHRAVRAPLLMEHACVFALPAAPADAYLFTSRAAPKHLARAIPAEARTLAACWCVGTRTAQAAREAGFLRAQHIGQDVEGLLAALPGLAKPGSCLWYGAGRRRRHDLSAAAAAMGIALSTIPCYDMQPVTLLPAEIALPTLDAVLLYSPFTAATLAHLLRNHDAAHLSFLCLSPAVAAEITALGGRVRIAQEPTESALLALLPPGARP